jgi:Protein of unknown function (DUF1350)
MKMIVHGRQRMMTTPTTTLKSSSMLLVFIGSSLLASWILISDTTAFSIHSSSCCHQRARSMSYTSTATTHPPSLNAVSSNNIFHQHRSTRRNSIRLHVGGGGPPGQDGDLMRGGGGGANSVDNSFSELTSALARASDSTVRNTRWTRLVLPPDDEEDENVREKIADPYSTTSQPPYPPVQEEYVWMLEPANVANGMMSEPSCTIVFTGGAGLGQFPHVAYNELLQRISNKLDAVVLAAPYTVGLDHFALAKDTGEKLRRGVIAYDDLVSKRTRTTKTGDANDTQAHDNNPSKPRRPVYSLAHSLGSKLQTIYLAATRQEWDGICVHCIQQL